MGRNYQTPFREAVTRIADDVGHHHASVVLDILKKALAKGGPDALVKELRAMADLDHVKYNREKATSDRSRIDLSNLCEDLEDAYEALASWAENAGLLKGERGTYLREKVESLGDSPLQKFGVQDRRERQELDEIRRQRRMDAAALRDK